MNDVIKVVAIVGGVIVTALWVNKTAELLDESYKQEADNNAAEILGRKAQLKDEYARMDNERKLREKAELELAKRAKKAA